MKKLNLTEKILFDTNYNKDDIAILRQGCIGDDMADFLYEQAHIWDIKKSVEIGVASGIGSLIILEAGSKEHHGIDINQNFYIENKFPTGAVVLNRKNFHLHIGKIIVIAKNLPKFNFVYIDADHRHPWPTIDLWNLAFLDKLEYPFKLVLDDVGLALAYRKYKFKNRGPLLLNNSLKQQFENRISTNINLNGIYHHNQSSFIINDKDKLIECLAISLSFPFESEIDSNDIY